MKISQSSNGFENFGNTDDLDTIGDPIASLSDRCYRQLRSALVEGTYPAGTLLLETKICEQLGVSRTPVRHALVQLEHEGFLEKGSRGYRVRTAQVDDIIEFYEARIALEAIVAAAAALRRTTFDLARIRAVHERMAIAPLDEAVQLTTQFHRTVWQASHNALLTNILEQITDRVYILDQSPIRTHEHIELVVSEHEPILAAIERRDAEAARALLEKHLTRDRDLRVRELLTGQ